MKKRCFSLWLCVLLLCAAFGNVCAATDTPFAFGGNSVSEEKSGLAFYFDVAVDGMAMDGFAAIYDNATVDGYPLVSMGAQISNGIETQRIPAKHLIRAEEHSTSFAVRVVQIPLTCRSTPITATPYYVVNKPGGAIIVYGQPQTTTYYHAQHALPALTEWHTNNILDALPEYENKRTDGALTFTMMSDTHLRQNAPHIVDNIEASSAWAHRTDNDFVLMAGDFIIGDLNKQASLNLIDTAIATAGKYGDLPVYAIKGNHDTNEDYAIGYDATGNVIYSTADRITEREFYDHAIAQSESSIVTDPANPYGGYYYVNFPEQKIRMICLNSIEIRNEVDILNSTKAEFRRNGSLSVEQMTWLANTALHVPEGWAVMVMSHIPPITGANVGVLNETTADAPFHTRGIRNADLTALLEAFVKGSKGSVRAKLYPTGTKTIPYDFTDQGAGEMIGFFSGHVHEDSHSVFNGIHYVVVNCTTPQKRWDTSPDRAANTETALSLNTFIVDRDTRTVQCVKIGTGESYTFTW